VSGNQRQSQVLAVQIRLLYDNACTGIVVTVVVAPLLAYWAWGVTPHLIVSGWLLYMLLVSAARYIVVRRYYRAAPGNIANDRWLAVFAAGAGLAAAGWGMAGVVLYPETRSPNQVLPVFVIGGMMLGGASLLAARPEAFLAFLLPTGLLPAMHLAVQGGEEHLTMALLAAVFTAATVVTTWRFFLMIESSLSLRWENQDLVERLQAARQQAEAVNRDLERRVRDRTAELVEADRRKNEFLATLAHELRNPLAPIRFALDSLRSGVSPLGASRAHDVIDRQTMQLVRLVDDLLDVARITANKIHLRRESHALARLMSTAVESVMPLARAAGHTVDVTLPSPAMCVNGDATRLVQVFANILNNAVKFTPRGGHIWFTAGQQSAEAVVVIRDTGIGIAPGALPHVFDMFQQAEPILERSTGGLGIGLTLARRLVAMHEGTIDVRSQGPGQGTEVEIRLPIAPASDRHAVEAERPSAVPPRTLRVLIVDDNFDAAEMLDVVVSRLGHATRLAHDGPAAVAAAVGFAPDVIFLDIGLPIMSGYAVARELRTRSEFDRVHIAAVTGWGQDEDRRQARDAGFDSHFTKPLSLTALEELLSSIAQHGQSASARDAMFASRIRLHDSGSSS
jgi:signal transduction histidine kinase/FixJ family two-component response regulator